MRNLGMNVMTDKNKWAMHHKVIIIDAKTVVTGSFNFSINAAETNDENILILRGNRDIARAYLDESERLSGSKVMTDEQPVATGGETKINTATAEQLMQLPDIGSTLAQRIIEYRQTHGKYQKLQDITKVKGIGKKTFDKIKDKISL